MYRFTDTASTADQNSTLPTSTQSQPEEPKPIESQLAAPALLNAPVIDAFPIPPPPPPVIDINEPIPNIDEIKLQYTKRLIPIFCKVFLHCMIQSISKSCLNLLRKLINCASKDQLNQIVQLDHTSNSNEGSKTTENYSEEISTISALLVELISKILQENQNYESILIGLSISNDLFKKCSPFILEEFTRLGVGHMISQVALDTMESSDENEQSKDSNSLVALEPIESKQKVIYFQLSSN